MVRRWVPRDVGLETALAERPGPLQLTSALCFSVHGSGCGFRTHLGRGDPGFVSAAPVTDAWLAAQGARCSPEASPSRPSQPCCLSLGPSQAAEGAHQDSASWSLTVARWALPASVQLSHPACLAGQPPGQGAAQEMDRCCPQACPLGRSWEMLHPVPHKDPAQAWPSPPPPPQEWQRGRGHRLSAGPEHRAEPWGPLRGPAGSQAHTQQWPCKLQGPSRRMGRSRGAQLLTPTPPLLRAPGSSLQGHGPPCGLPALTRPLPPAPQAHTPFRLAQPSHKARSPLPSPRKPSRYLSAKAPAQPVTSPTSHPSR